MFGCKRCTRGSGFTLSFGLLFFTMIFITFAFASGASSKPVPRQKSSTQSSKQTYENRKKANEWFVRGEKLQDQKLFKEAAQKYQKAVKIDSGYAEAFSNLGYCYRKQGRHSKAVNYYTKAIKLDPKLEEAHEYLGEAYAEMEKFKLAEKELKILKKMGSDEAEELEEFINQLEGSQQTPD